MKTVKGMFDAHNVFAKATAMVEKYRGRAEAIADEVNPPELRQLLYYLIDTVLEVQAAPEEPQREFMVELGLGARG